METEDWHAIFVETCSRSEPPTSQRRECPRLLRPAGLREYNHAQRKLLALEHPRRLADYNWIKGQLLMMREPEAPQTTSMQRQPQNDSGKRRFTLLVAAGDVQARSLLMLPT